MYKNKIDKVKYARKYYLEHRKKCSCGKLVAGHNRGKCHSCAAKEYWEKDIERKKELSKQFKGKNNPMFGTIPWNYKGIEKKCKCIDCGNKISKNAYYRGKRCKSCESKRRIKIGITGWKKGEGALNKNYNWQGGISFEPYSAEWSINLRESIRKRDNHKCQLCGMTEKANIKRYHRKLTVHHIDYNKKHCKPKNLISVCSKCNSVVNFNRNKWIKFFKHLMKGKS
jgi:5-methylcytosine-specific restriction endonuclease McrA